MGADGEGRVRAEPALSSLWEVAFLGETNVVALKNTATRCWLTAERPLGMAGEVTARCAENVAKARQARSPLDPPRSPSAADVRAVGNICRAAARHVSSSLLPRILPGPARLRRESTRARDHPGQHVRNNPLLCFATSAAGSSRKGSWLWPSCGCGASAALLSAAARGQNGPPPCCSQGEAARRRPHHHPGERDPARASAACNTGAGSLSVVALVL